jgi:cbb3-type cytochrome oxidase subunit 1
MPKLSVYFIRAAMLYLILGFTFGGLILVQKGMPIWPAAWRLLPAHIEFLLFGWTVQLVMGVGFWIFPRFRRSRGDERPAWLAFGLLNLGVLLIGLGPLFNAPALVCLIGRLSEVGAVGAFALHSWPRIKPPGAPTPRETAR